MAPPLEVDVLIVGGGPVGLLIGHCLARYDVSTYIVEQRTPTQQARYGRAAMVAPRTLEMLDQLDLVDELAQVGFVVRGQISFRGGERVPGISSPSSGIEGTEMDFVLLVRQKVTEGVMREAYVRKSGREVGFGERVVGVSVGVGGGGVLTTVEAEGRGVVEIRSRFLVGADGGRSTVRELVGISFEGEKSGRCWVRIDGVVETDMPDSRRGMCAVESETHGSVLWACLDHGATRVGFALPGGWVEERGERITLEDVMEEAKKAMMPFELAFKSVDWWTVYSVGQRLAGCYRKDGRVFIAGDAAHTHSSGAAQGMNTGLHDAVNLSWKLAGYVNGWLQESVLDTYEAERRPVARQVIEQDKIISVLIGGGIPDSLRDGEDRDPHRLLTESHKRNKDMLSGLGIRYPADGITVVESSPTVSRGPRPGERAPDVLIQRPGVRVPIRLYSVSKNDGKFSLLHFCGDPSQTKHDIRRWREYIDTDTTFNRNAHCISTQITVMLNANTSGSPAEHLGVKCFGTAFYDVDGSAHERYSVGSGEGRVFVLRPDGTVGMGCALGEGGEVGKYLAGIVVAERDRGEDIGGVREGEEGRGTARGQGERGVGNGTNGEVDLGGEAGGRDVQEAIQ